MAQQEQEAYYELAQNAYATWHFHFLRSEH